MFTFSPTSENVSKVTLPYFEEARSDFAPYYRSAKSISHAQIAISSELEKLGANVQHFQNGIFQDGKVKRHGYSIKFEYAGGPGIIRVAGLPMKFSVTDKKLKKVKVQALLNVRDWLNAAVTSKTFSPGSDILIPFMLVDQTPGQEKTLAEYIATTGMLPGLPAPKVSAQELIMP